MIDAAPVAIMRKKTKIPIQIDTYKDNFMVTLPHAFKIIGMIIT
jgi:hypothetical protein